MMRLSAKFCASLDASEANLYLLKLSTKENGPANWPTRIRLVLNYLVPFMLAELTAFEAMFHFSRSVAYCPSSISD